MASRVARMRAITNRILTTIAAALMDGSTALRRYTVDNFIVEGFNFEQERDLRCRKSPATP
jgi:hypothetical protein